MTNPFEKAKTQSNIKQGESQEEEDYANEEGEGKAKHVMFAVI